MMKKLAFAFILGAAVFACGEEETTIIDSSMPQGTFSVSAIGTIVEQNDTGSAGTVEVGTDSEGTSFLKFDDDFMTNLGTGTVTVFLSTTSDDLKEVFSPGTGNTEVILVGVVSQNGEQYFKLASSVASKYDNVVLWCASAGIPFGYAEIQ